MQEESKSTHTSLDRNSEEDNLSTSSSSLATSSKKSYQSHALSTGLYLALISIFMQVLIYIVDEHSLGDNFSPLGILTMLLVLGMCVFRGRQFASQQSFFTYSSSFGYSFFALYVNMLVAIVWTIFLYHVVDPELPERLLYIQEEKMYEGLQDRENVDEIVEQSMRFTRWFYKPFGLLIAGVVFGGLWTLVISLLTAIGIYKAKPKEVL